MNTDMRIKDTKEFNEILNKGKKIYNERFIIYYKERKKDHPRFGITQTKKYGKAFQRNKIHRQMREIIRKNQNIFKKEFDYIIIVRKYSDNQMYDELEKSFKQLIKERL